jgi:hypothetical protein
MMASKADAVYYFSKDPQQGQPATMMASKADAVYYFSKDPQQGQPATMMASKADAVYYFSKDPRRMNHQLRVGEVQRFFLALPAGFDASRVREVPHPSAYLRFAQQSISVQLHLFQALSRAWQDPEWPSLAPDFPLAL